MFRWLTVVTEVVALMHSREVGRPSHGGDPKKQVKPCGDHQDVPSEAVDILVDWITEDMEAVAESFGANSTQLLEIALERLRFGAAVSDLSVAVDSKNGSNARSLR